MEEVNAYSISTKKFTCAIEVKYGIITKTAPILKSFKGKSIIKLYDWLDEYYTDNYKVERLINA